MLQHFKTTIDLLKHEQSTVKKCPAVLGGWKQKPSVIRSQPHLFLLSVFESKHREGTVAFQAH
jgi:hypothetical protein